VRGFFKKRGYEDSDELTKHEIASLAGSEDVRLPAQADLRPTGLGQAQESEVLNEAGSFLENGQFGLAVVAASTGMKGDSDKNRRLTEAQTMVVRDYLVQNFRLDDTRIKTIGLGKVKAAGDTGGVEITVYPHVAGSRKELARQVQNNSSR